MNPPITTVDDPKSYPVEFSVVVSCYYEEKSIDEFHARLTRAMEQTGRSFEIVIVNDGSTDGTFEKIKAIQQRDPHVTTVIDLFRNAGQAAAITAGIAHCRGAHLISMDSDLQLDPEELPLLIEAFDRGYDIVSGYRKNRRDSWRRTLPSFFANMVMRKTARHHIKDFGCTFKIYDGRLVRAFGFGPQKEFTPTYVFSRAQKCIDVPVTHHPRKYGRSGWTLKKLIGYYMDNLIGVSQRPFQIIAFACLSLSVILLLRILAGWVINFHVLSTVSPGLILNAILVCFLVLMFVLCVIGEYSIRSFIKLQGYPIYVIRKLRRREG